GDSGQPPPFSFTKTEYHLQSFKSHSNNRHSKLCMISYSNMATQYILLSSGPLPER
ncbi:hypothetical protein SUGI_0920200, partial [Cryptomeria japonica]